MGRVPTLVAGTAAAQEISPGGGSGRGLPLAGPICLPPDSGGAAAGRRLGVHLVARAGFEPATSGV